MHETITISVGGSPFPLYATLTVTASVKESCRAMHLTFPDTFGAPRWPRLFKGQPKIVASAGGDLLFTGFVDHCGPHFDDTTYRVDVTARSQAQDAVDCTVDHTKPDYVKSDVHKVAQDQDRFNIGFACDFKPDGFDRWRPNPGDRLFESLTPLCEEEGATMAGQPDGSVKITRAGASATPHAGAIVEGVNIISAHAIFDDTAKHSKVKAHGQTAKGSGQQALQIVGEADNDTVQRFRPLELHHDRETSRDRLKRLAQRRRDKETGEGVRCVVELKTWRDSAGKLWTPGQTIWVQSPSLDVAQRLLIEGALYSVTAGHAHHGDGGEGERHAGTMATLHLVDPRAHGGKGGGVNQSGDSWGFDTSAAT